MDCLAAKSVANVFCELAKNEVNVNSIVDCGAVPALLKHLKAPESVREGDGVPKPCDHEVEKECVIVLARLAVKPEHQQLIVDAEALPYLINLSKRHRTYGNSEALTGLICRAADAIMNIVYENNSIKTVLGWKVVSLLLLNCLKLTMQQFKSQL